MKSVVEGHDRLQISLNGADQSEGKEGGPRGEDVSTKTTSCLFEALYAWMDRPSYSKFALYVARIVARSEGGAARNAHSSGHWRCI